MKPVRLSRHARNSMRLYRISEEAVIAAAIEPAWTGPDPRPGVERRYTMPAELEGRVLRVSCIDTDRDIFVLSAHPDRKARSPDDA